MIDYSTWTDFAIFHAAAVAKMRGTRGIWVTEMFAEVDRRIVDIPVAVERRRASLSAFNTAV